MIKIKNTKVYGLEESIIRSGYPMSVTEPQDFYEFDTPGESLIADLDGTDKVEEHLNRVKKLGSVPSGTGHDNFLKGVIVQFDLRYPEYFSPQLQRYSWVDIISSQSKMHRITSRELTCNDFVGEVALKNINAINLLVMHYKKEPNEEIKGSIFRSIVANLPCGYMKWMGISTNYLQLKTIYKQRKNHKLIEWHQFCDWIESLPYFKLLTQ